MLALDKLIALVLLLICLIYGYAAIEYPLLPFERNMAFLPNTMPKVLSALGIVFALIILLSPAHAPSVDEGGADSAAVREYKFGQAFGLIGAMIVYALVLRPLGFVAATTVFLVGTGWVLGERKLPIMLAVALVASISVWYLVQETLGIFLRPWPWFIE